MVLVYPVIFFLFVIIKFKLFFAVNLNLSCGDLVLKPWGQIATGGRTSSCGEYYVSYESCRALLLVSKECSAFLYRDKICSLLDRRQPDFRLIENVSIDGTAKSLVGLVVYKVSEGVDTCNVEQDHIIATRQSSLLARSELNRCIFNAMKIPPNSNSFLDLPILHIVISVTESWINNNRKEIDLVTAHWKCYAKLFGYLFTLNILSSYGSAEFFVERHESISNKFLQTAQWILHIDADSIALNMSRPISSILPSYDNTQPFHSSHSIILQMRENGEITSGIYLVRNDLRAKCFLAYWRAFHPPWLKLNVSTVHGSGKTRIIPAPNNCNGALVSAMLHLVAPIIASQCLKNYSYDINKRPYPYPEQYCLHQYRTKVYSLSLGIVPPSLARSGIQVLWNRQGLWRTQEKFDPNWGQYSEIQSELYVYCYPSSDIIGHGNKNIASDMLLPHQSTQCNITTKNMFISGINPICKWMSIQDERRVIRTYCFWRSPACIILPNGTNECTLQYSHEDGKETAHGMNSNCLEYHHLIQLDRKNLQSLKEKIIPRKISIY